MEGTARYNAASTVARSAIAALDPICPTWDGRDCVLEMREAAYPHWRQMEWMGFYFQYQCEILLRDVMKIPGPKYGNAEFDGFAAVPWDFKCHAVNATSSEIIVNDLEAIANGIAEYGHVGAIVAKVDAVYDDMDRSFQKWHDTEKGNRSRYVEIREREGRPSRRRKSSVKILEIAAVLIGRADVKGGGRFQEGMRNADGSQRRAKLKLRESDINRLTVARRSFR